MGGKTVSIFAKRNLLFFNAAVAALLLLLFAGCSKKNADDDAALGELDADSSAEETFVKIESASSTIESVMLGGSLWRENASGYMEWVKDLPSGTAVGAYRNTDAAETFPAEIKRNAMRTSDWSRKNFVHVLYNSEDYWVQDVFLAVNAKPGVVIDGGSFLYASREDTSSAGRWVSEGVELAVLNPSAEGGDASSKMVEVSVYLRDFGLVPNRFMVSEKISTKADDIAAMHIMAKLGQRGGNGMLLIQDGVVRRELKDVAGRLEISDAVRARIKNY